MTGKSKQRQVRPVERQPMRDWLLDKLNGKEIPGLEWVQKHQKIFRIKWCHGSRHGWSLKDSILFEKWAQHSGRHHDGDPKRWKANFRCALNSLKDVEEVKDMSVSKGQNAFRVYRMLESRKKPEKPRAVRRRKSEPAGQRVLEHDSSSEDTDVKFSLPLEAVSDFDKTLSSEDDDMMLGSESEGYQTDVQEETLIDWSAGERLTLSPDLTADGAESSSQINIPNFDKIIPDFYKIEFGKNHLLLRHSSGFKVDLLKQQTPLEPTLQPFKIPLQESCLTKPITTRSQTNFSTHFMPGASSTLQPVNGSQSSSSTQQTASLPSLSQISKKKSRVSGTSQTSVSAGDMDKVYSYLTCPETPDGSEASSDSNSGEYIELTIYEEEVSDTPGTYAYDSFVVTDKSKAVQVTSHQTQLHHTAEQEHYGGSQTIISANSYRYSPLTPP